MAGDAQDVGNPTVNSGLENFAVLITPSQEALSQPSRREISRRHQSKGNFADYSNGGPNLLFADLHVEYRSRLSLKPSA